MQAKQFIDLLEKQGLLDDDILVELRRQVADSKTKVSPEALARLLVDNGQLTRFQAQKLIATLKDAPDTSSTGQESSGVVTAEDSELDMLPADLIPQSKKQPPPVGNKAIVLDDEDEAEIVADVVEVEEVVEVAEVIEVPEAEPVRSRTSTAPKSMPADNFPKVSTKPVVTSKKPKKNQWDSFRILGVSTMLLILLVFFGGLGYWFWKGNAGEWLDRAKQDYQGRDYDAALYKYTEFLKRFPTDENASFAKVRVVLSKIRGKSEKGSDPLGAMEVAKAELPLIANEPGLGPERSDLAGALLTIAEKFSQRADAAKAIDEKKKLIGQLDDHWQLVTNAQYIGTQERNQSEARIKRIEEGRARIIRDIERSEDLVAAVAKIKEALEKKDVFAAYGFRRDVVRKHIQLESEPELLQLIEQATKLQQGLVGTAKSLPRIDFESSDKPTDSRMVVLANESRGQSSKANSVPEKGVIVLRAKQSLYGLDTSSGRVLWRTFIGRNSVSDPQRMSAEPESDYLYCLPAEGIVRRISAQNGKVQWQATLDSPINEPTVDREEVFVTSVKGGVYALDAVSGQIKWGRQLPQAIQVSPGLGSGKDVLYVLGDHSNLYIMMRKDGNCPAVHYIGHQGGSIRVSPIVALGQLLIFENHEPGRSQVRTYRLSEDGQTPTASQSPLKLVGHVAVRPIHDGRKLAIATDLGEISVFEFDTSSDQTRLIPLANRVAIESQPKSIWPLMSGSELWIAGSSLTRFQIVGAKQTLDSQWVKEDQDQFVGRPIRIGEHIVSSRILRGTMGVRVSAIQGVSGEVAWEVNLGAPVSWLQATNDGFPIYAITTAATCYSISKEAISGKEPSKIVENVGRGERAVLFRNPFQLSDGRTVLVNESLGNQIVLADTRAPERSQFRRVAMAIGSSAPNAPALGVGGNVLLPLNNGQLQLIDPTTGQSKAEPFQPKLEAGQKHGWVGPALLSDNQSVVVSDSLRRIYRLGTGAQLRSLAERDLGRALQGQLVAINDTVVGVATGVTGDTIEVINGIDLESMASIGLQGKITWGPYRLKGLALVCSDNEGLVAIDREGRKVWELSLPQASLVGSPIEYLEDMVIADVRGKLIRVSIEEGKLIGMAEVGEPISGTPINMDGVLIVPGEEGSILAVKGPEANAGVSP